MPIRRPPAFARVTAEIYYTCDVLAAHFSQPRQKMKAPILAILACGLLFATVATVVGADLSPTDVRNAIDLGVKYLKQCSGPQHREMVGLLLCMRVESPPFVRWPCSTPAKARKRPTSRKRSDYLRKLHSTLTYVVSLQTMVLCRATPVADQDMIAHNVEWLETTQVRGDPADLKGGWSYGLLPNGQSGVGDASNSQFALLALYEAARVAENRQIHFKIQRETWERARAYWRVNQYARRGLGLLQDPPAHRQHDLPGIASLVITGDVLHEPDARVSGDQIDGCYQAAAEDQNRIERGIEWLRQHFTVQEEPAQHDLRQPALALLLSLRAGACGATHRAAQDRRERLVS